jgi:hypothetical protein
MTGIMILLLKVLIFCFLIPAILPPALFLVVIAGKIDQLVFLVERLIKF